MKRALESKWTQQQAFISNVSILIHATSERPEGGQRGCWLGLQHRLSTYPKKHNKQILRHPVDAVDPPHVGEMQSFHVPRHWRCAEEWELWTKHETPMLSYKNKWKVTRSTWSTWSAWSTEAWSSDSSVIGKDFSIDGFAPDRIRPVNWQHWSWKHRVKMPNFTENILESA